MSMASAGMAAGMPDEFRVGNVLNRAMGVLSRHFVFFFLVAIVGLIPSIVLALSTANGRPVPSTTAAMVLVAVFANLILLPITQTVSYHAAFQDMLGRAIRPGDSLALAIRRFFPVLGALICLGLAIGFGFILLVVPGIILALMFAISIPACVVERLGPIASLRRSAGLTKGSRWKILGVALLLLVLSLVGAALNYMFKFGFGLELGSLIGFVIQAVIGAFYSVVGVVMYHDLRVAKEGVGTDRIAAVFD